jgi:uncharacterized protein DUF742
MSSPSDDPSNGGEDPDVSLVRPYLLTSGRAQPIDQSLEIEAQVVTDPAAGVTAHELAFERRDIVTLCREPKSVAEVASILGLHIGVARVLVADLAQLGYVGVTRPAAQPSYDVDLIERVIRGLESIA